MEYAAATTLQVRRCFEMFSRNYSFLQTEMNISKENIPVQVIRMPPALYVFVPVRVDLLHVPGTHPSDTRDEAR